MLSMDVIFLKIDNNKFLAFLCQNTDQLNHLQ